MKLASPPPVVSQVPRRPVAYISSDPHRWPAWFIPVLCWVGIPTLAVLIVLMLH